MKIKLTKNWRAFGEIQKAGSILNINDNNIIKYLKDNNFIGIKEKKNKKSDVKITESKKIK